MLEPARLAADKPVADVCLDMLGKWFVQAERDWKQVDADTGYYGTGTAGWGVMAQSSYIAIAGVLARAEGLVPDDFRSLAFRRLSMAIAYWERTHCTGDLDLVQRGARGRQGGGMRWGAGLDFSNAWHTGVFIEQAFCGLEPVWNDLDGATRNRLSDILEHEANYHADYGIAEDVRTLPGRIRHNCPESNVWTAAAVTRAALYLPEHPRASEWTECAHRLWINGLSVPQDEWDETVLDGRPVAERFVGANLGPRYTLVHHGFFHSGYYAWCLWPTAMISLSFTRRCLQPPQSSRRHFDEAFDVVKRLFAGEGRLLYPGGQDWPQYAYGQLYLMAVCAYKALYDADAAASHMLGATLANVREEFRLSGDGSFTRPRLATLRRTDPVRFFRYESDPGMALALIVRMCRDAGKDPVDPLETADFLALTSGRLCERSIGLAVEKTPQRFASFVGTSFCSRTQVMMMPTTHGHFFSQNGNGFAEPVLADDAGELFVRRPMQRTCWVTDFEGGIAGSAVLDSQPFPKAESGGGDVDEVRHQSERCAVPLVGPRLDRRPPMGAPSSSLPKDDPRQYRLRRALAFLALPDGVSGVFFDMVQALAPAHLLVERGMGLCPACDIFHDEPPFVLASAQREPLAWSATRPAAVRIQSPWVYLSGGMSVHALYGGDAFGLERRPPRDPDGKTPVPVFLKRDDAGSAESLQFARLYFPYHDHQAEEGRPIRAGTIVRDACSLWRIEPDRTKPRLAEQHDTITAQTESFKTGAVRGVRVGGADGRCYGVLVNFGPGLVTQRWPFGDTAERVMTGDFNDDRRHVRLAPGEVVCAVV